MWMVCEAGQMYTGLRDLPALRLFHGPTPPHASDVVFKGVRSNWVGAQKWRDEKGMVNRL